MKKRGAVKDLLRRRRPELGRQFPLPLLIPPDRIFPSRHIRTQLAIGVPGPIGSERKHDERQYAERADQCGIGDERAIVRLGRSGEIEL
jgi:hypothetical protein